jgi:hypothetical protein
MTLDAVVAKAARRQRCVYGGLIADEIKRGDFFIGLKREFRARNHDSATVVAAHDIHCDSHSEIKSAENLRAADTRPP